MRRALAALLVLLAVACGRPEAHEVVIPAPSTPAPTAVPQTIVVLRSPSPHPTGGPTPGAVRSPEPPPRARATSSPGIPEQIVDLWPGDDRRAIAVTRCESDEFDPRVAYGPRTGPAGERGAWQIHPGWFDGRWGSPELTDAGFAWDEMWDLRQNTLAAWWIRARYGWWPWTCARSLGYA